MTDINNFKILLSSRFFGPDFKLYQFIPVSNSSIVYLHSLSHVAVYVDKIALRFQN